MKTVRSLFLAAILFPILSGAQTPAGLEATLQVVQVTEKGFLATGRIEEQPGSGSSQIIKDVVFIYCQTGQLADGDTVEKVIFPAGTMKYQSVTGAEKTVHAYALSADGK